MQDTGLLNEKTAKTIIKELIHQGVRTFFIAPGSRSTALVTAAAEHPLAKTHVHFDERALGFMALGYGKAKKAPAALILTSGTAVANVLPAIVEASQSNVPLVVLSADRPPELQACGANQTIEQNGIFSSYVRCNINFPVPSPDLETSYYSSTIAEAVYHAKTGPVQINCPFRKPFLAHEAGQPYAAPKSKPQTGPTYFQPQTSITDQDATLIAERLSHIENGVILAGSMDGIDIESLETLSRILQWPILADVTSSVRSHGPITGLARHYDLILGSLPPHEELFVDGVLHLGGPLVTKRVHDWLGKHKPKTYVHVKNSPKRQEHLHLASHHIPCDPSAFIQNILEHIPGRGPSSWMGLWNNLASVVTERLATFFERDEICEPAALNLLNDLPENTAAFIGNSMPIRDADSFFFPRKPTGPIFANRGASGIDGNIATAAGIVKALNSPMLAIMGDQTLLHDIGSLSTLKSLDTPFVLLAINNGGGGIFSFLPIHEKKAIFETHFAAAHTQNFKGIAQSFGLTYHAPTTCKTLSSTLQEAFASNSPTLIEITTKRDDNLKLHRDLLSELSGLNLSEKAVPFPAYART